MKKTILAILLFTSSAAAQEIYPSDYTPSPCASGVSCVSFTDVSFEAAAAKFLLLNLDPKWHDAHREALTAMVQPFCAKRATCIASPGREPGWCGAMYRRELRDACRAKYAPGKDGDQCRIWVDVYAAGVAQHGAEQSKRAQECLKSLASSAAAPRTLKWWSVPAVIPADYDGLVRIIAVDEQTHVPMQANLTFEGRAPFFTADSPNGRLMTFYEFPWPQSLLRVPNAAGHTDLSGGTVTLTAPGYATVTGPLPVIIPTMKITTVPPLKGIRHGATNRITIVATDSVTGKPVEAQVFAGAQTIGFTNQLIELPLGQKEKRPELWVRSPYDKYGDVVVAPAEK